MSTYEDGVCRAVGVEPGTDGATFAQVELKKLVLAGVARLQKAGHVDGSITVNLQADGANLYRHTKVVNVVARVMTTEARPCDLDPERDCHT